MAVTNRPGTVFQSFTRNIPQGLMRSQDAGMTWQTVWTETPVRQVVASPNFDDDETVFASLPDVSPTLGTRFIISHDGGDTWLAGGQGLCPDETPFRFQVSPAYSEDHTLLASTVDTYTSGRLYISHDDGLTWQVLFPSGAPNCEPNSNGAIFPYFSPDYSTDRTIYFGSYQGLYATYDAGASWVLLLHGLVSNLEVRRTPDTDPVSTGNQPHPYRPAANQVWYFPLIAVAGSGPIYNSHNTLFIIAYAPPNWEWLAQYRSDDGGRTWQCMEQPQVQARQFLPLLIR